jgi:hypothetical protein
MYQENELTVLLNYVPRDEGNELTVLLKCGLRMLKSAVFVFA